MNDFNDVIDKNLRDANLIVSNAQHFSESLVDVAQRVIDQHQEEARRHASLGYDDEIRWVEAQQRRTEGIENLIILEERRLLLMYRKQTGGTR